MQASSAPSTSPAPRSLRSRSNKKSAPKPADEAPTVSAVRSEAELEALVDMVHRVQTPASPLFVDAEVGVTKGHTKERVGIAWRCVLALVQLWHAYLWSLEQWPVTSKAITAAVISGISELLAQFIMGKMDGCNSLLTCVDWTSLRNQFLIGLIFRGAPIHFWYLALSWMFSRWTQPQPQSRHSTPRPESVSLLDVKSGVAKGSASGGVAAMETFRPKEPLWVVFAKVAVDQLTFGPFNNWLYFFVIAWFEHRPMSSAWAALNRDFVPLMLANYRVWPLVSLLNFRFVPPHLQVLAGNIVAVGWTVYVLMLTSAK